MKQRVLVFEENEIISSTLKEILQERGYEVIIFPDSGVCPLSKMEDHTKISNASCADIIISDIYMPTVEGLNVIKNRVDRGCGVTCRALMSADWSDVVWQYAKRIGCRLFSKPFDLEDMLEWLDDCAKQVGAERKLFNFPHNNRFSGPFI